NPKASRKTFLDAAKTCGIVSQDTINQAVAEADDNKAREIIYFAILDGICSLKDTINAACKELIIFEANWSKNESAVDADRALTERHGVNYKIEMLMRDTDAVRVYFSHPGHLALVAKFN